jgi:hypothetical protein
MLLHTIFIIIVNKIKIFDESYREKQVPVADYSKVSGTFFRRTCKNFVDRGKIYIIGSMSVGLEARPR